MKTVTVLLLLACAACSSIDISGLDRTAVFIALYKNARCSRPWLLRKKMTPLETAKYIGGEVGEIHGVRMNIRVPKEDEESNLDASKYNEANGVGLGERVVEKLRRKMAGECRYPPPFSVKDQAQMSHMIGRPY